MLNRDWSQLPQELLAEIYRHLNTNIEHLYFRSVCQSWRSSALEIPSLTPILHLPDIPHQEIYLCYLTTQELVDDDYDFLVEEFEQEQRDCSIAGYNLVESNIHVLHSCSSSKNPFYQAWLFKAHETRQRNVFRFLDPLFRTPIKISPWMFSEELNTLDTKCTISGVFKEYHLERVEQDSDLDRFILKRVVLSPTATVKDYVIMAVHPCGILILFRSGDTKWTVINPGTGPAIQDVIHYKGQYYVVDSAGGTYVVDPHTSALTQFVELFSAGGEGRKYLIESNGELFLVNVFCSGSVGDSNLWIKMLKALACDFDGYSFQKIYPHGVNVRSAPVKFAVYKLDERKQEWTEVKSLGDRIFFVGERSSFSISNSESLLGCKGNCIFFADFSLESDFYAMEHGRELKHFTNVFNLEDNTIQTLADYPSCSHLFWPPPDFDCAAELRF